MESCLFCNKAYRHPWLRLCRSIASSSRKPEIIFCFWQIVVTSLGFESGINLLKSIATQFDWSLSNVLYFIYILHLVNLWSVCHYLLLINNTAMFKACCLLWWLLLSSSALMPCFSSLFQESLSPICTYSHENNYPVLRAPDSSGPSPVVIHTMLLKNSTAIKHKKQAYSNIPFLLVNQQVCLSQRCWYRRNT